ncbi:hypothetical protein CNR22_14320 [Sphingobacteriaceae bacterium]|nr:hypothetical protein CNR22_14320 [Sphingobacteriaceae bacterium]
MKKNLFNLKTTAFAVGIFFTTLASAQFTAVTSGDWSNSATWGGTAPSPTVSNQNITIPANITVNLDADVTFSGLLNTFAVNGMLTNTTNNGVHMTSGNFTGTGTVSIGKMTFSLLGAITYAGTMNVKHLANFISGSSTLAFASVANISDTLELESGNLGLNTNGNLTMAAGSTVKVRNGALVINSGVFNSGNAYNVMYLGSSKTAGVELNSATVQNIYLNMSSNTQSVTLANNTTVNGNLNLSNGTLKINNNKLTLKGDILISSGAMISSTSSSSLIVEGTGSTTNFLRFTTGSSLDALTINRTSTGVVKLGTDLQVTSNLYLMEGNLSLELGGNLMAGANSTIHVQKGTLSANSGTFTGSSAYNVEYAGTSDITSGIELSGSSLNQLMVNFTGASNKVMLASNTTVNSTLYLTSGKLDLNGKVLTLSALTATSANGTFIGSATSELNLNLTAAGQNTLYFDNASTSNQTLKKLVINIGGTTNIVLGTKLFINNELQFTKGKLELGNGDLEIMPSASITGYDDTKYIVTSDNGSGVLIQNVTSAGAYVTFPVGLTAAYSPAYVQQTATGTTGNFSVKAQSMYNASLKAVDRQWFVEGAGVTTVNANLKFGWKATSELNAFDRTNAFVSHYTSGAWDVTASSSATAGVNGTFELSRMGLTSLSPFAVVENGQTVGIKEVAKLTGIELYPNPSKDVLNIKVASSTDEYQFELIDVTGRTLLTTITTNSVNKFDVSSLGAGCYFVKITNITENKTTTKRFVKQ